MKIKYIALLGCLVFPLQFATAEDVGAGGDAAGFSGRVLETTNTAGYTYVQVDTGKKKLWATTTQFAVKVGDNVTVAAGVPMTDYHSKTLNRTFDVVYFTSGISVSGAAAAAATPALPPGHPALSGAAGGGDAALPPGHPSLTAAPAATNLDLTGIQRAEGGKTIQEIYAAKAGLAGKPVIVRGKVVKYNAMILGRNWLHLRDGSGTKENQDNDLTVTTESPAALGATVVVSGNLSTNRDFGAGYSYSVMIEDAKVVKE